MRHPTKFGKYLLLERIAVGGMAEVFVAKAFGVEFSNGYARAGHWKPGSPDTFEYGTGLKESAITRGRWAALRPLAPLFMSHIMWEALAALPPSPKT